jgi:hypothetical protein
MFLSSMVDSKVGYVDTSFATFMAMMFHVEVFWLWRRVVW